MKKFLSKLLNYLFLDELFRRINKDRLLVLSYHSVCQSDNCPPLFTHLPVDVFKDQMLFLKKYYKVLSMNDLLICLNEKKSFPERAALVTFDDGFMNCYKVAFPVLKELQIPATIFLPVEYVGTENFLWFDELFLLIKQAVDSKIDLDVITKNPVHSICQKNIADIYPILSREFKIMSHEDRIRKISALKSEIKINASPMVENFRLLTWEQVKEMKATGLIDFGVHTATHRIVSELQKHELEREIIAPKEKLSWILGCGILSFSYPNGIPGADFNDFHERYLKKVGYLCAFCTGEWLNSSNQNPYRLGKIPAGNDLTSEKNIFRLNTSGFTEKIRKLKQRTL